MSLFYKIYNIRIPAHRYRALVLVLCLGCILSPAVAMDKQAGAALRVRGDFNYPPFEFVNEFGIPDGFTVDIMKEVAQVTGLSIDIHMGPWDEVRSELESGKIDILMGMYKTKERSRKADFSLPHLIVTYRIFVRKGSPVRSIEDLKGKTIIVQKNDLGHDFIVDKKISDKIIEERDWANTLHVLSHGVGDCAIISHLQGMRLIKKLNLRNIEAVGPPLLQQQYCIAVAKGKAALLSRINEGLSIMKTTGEYDRIYEKWFGIYVEPSAKRYLKYFLWILIPLIMTSAAGLLWSWSLKKKVGQQTAALKESMDMFRLIAEQTKMGIIIIQDDLIKFVNRAVSEINEYTIDEMLTWSPRDYLRTVYPEDIPRVIGHAERSKDRNMPEAVTDEWRIVSRSGTVKWIAVYSRLIEFYGKPADLSAVVDITEKKKMQEFMVRNEKMITVGNLAAGMAHELNNPLGIILQGLENIQHRFKTEDDKNKATALECNTTIDAISTYAEKRKITRYLQAVRQAGERASDIIISMLQFTRKSEGGKSDENIHNLIENAISFLAGDYSFIKKYDFKMIRIIREYDNGLPPLPCVKTELEQVFLNILKNAAQALAEMKNRNTEPWIKIKTKELESHIAISISDNGPGMDNETLHHIFDPFFSTKSSGSGTGLGLSVSYFIITDKHGGSIRAESEQGKGTTFLIELPL